MSASWITCTLGEALTLKRGYDLPAQNRLPGNVPIVTSSGITAYHAEAKAKGPGVVTGRYGTLGEVYYLKTDYWPHNTSLYVQDFKGNDPRFVYYFLKTLGLARQNGAAAVPGVDRNVLHRLRVRTPPLPAQRKIAATLSAYDDLIENNTRRIKLLEEMAQRIYREWFVDFRYPGHEDVPLVNSELGPIPEGWVVQKLNDIATVDKGLSYKGAFLTDDGIPMANLKCFLVGGGFRRDGTKPYSGDFKPKHRVTPGDLILANTDLTQAGAVIGSPAIIPRRGFEEGGLISHHLFAIRPRKSTLTNGVLFHILADERFRSFARSRASGTTVLGFRASDCEEYRIPVPKADVLSRFSEFVGPTFGIVQILRESSEVASATRDLLLPRLISGEIDVDNVNIQVNAPA